MHQDDFNFHVPIEIEKGGDSKEMRIKGIASTVKKDSDKEVLIPKGFDLNFFKSSGFLNWNHLSGKDPSAIIGEPTDAKITENNELYIEGILYPESAKAKEVWSLAKSLEGSLSRNLGFSIEGKVIERDPNDKNKITKAMITGCAITPSPKNPGTLLEIVKGDYTHSDPIFDTEKSEDPNGGKIEEYIIDITDDSGVRRTVDKNLNIKVIKMDTTATAPLMMESVEGHTKNKVKKQEFFQKNEGRLSKSEMFTEILSIFEIDDVEKGVMLLSLMDSVESKNNNDNKMNSYSQDTIKKALEILKLAEGVDFKKGDLPEGEEADKKEAVKKDEKPKETPSEDSVEKMKEDYDSYMKKAESLKFKIENSQASEETQGGKITTIKKGEEITSVLGELVGEIKSLKDDLKKGNEPSTPVENVEPDKSGDEIKKAIALLTGEISKLKDEPLLPRSVSVNGYTERFEKGNGNDTRSKMSIRGDKKALVDKLYDMSGLEKGENVNQTLVRGAQNLEFAGNFGNLQDTILKSLEAENIFVTD